MPISFFKFAAKVHKITQWSVIYLSFFFFRSAYTRVQVFVHVRMCVSVCEVHIIKMRYTAVIPIYRVCIYNTPNCQWYLRNNRAAEWKMVTKDKLLFCYRSQRKIKPFYDHKVMTMKSIYRTSKQKQLSVSILIRSLITLFLFPFFSFWHLRMNAIFFSAFSTFIRLRPLFNYSLRCHLPLTPLTLLTLGIEFLAKNSLSPTLRAINETILVVNKIECTKRNGRRNQRSNHTQILIDANWVIWQSIYS